MEFKLRSLVMTVYFPAFLCSMCIGMLAPTIPAKVDIIGGTAFIIGLAVGARGLGEAIFAIPTGHIINKIGNKKVMLVGMVGISISSLIAGLSQNNINMYISLLFLGIFYGFFSLSRHSFMTQLVPIPKRGKAFSRFGGINRIGWFCGPVIGGFTAGILGIDIPFFLVSIVSLLTGFIVFFNQDPKIPENNQIYTQKKTENLLKNLSQNKYSITFAGSAHFIMQFLREARHVIIPIFAFQIGLSVEELGLIQSLSAAVDMSLFYPVGIIMDRFGRKWTSVPSMFLLSAGFFLMPISSSFVTLLMAGVLLGLANGLGSGAMLTLGSDLAPKKNPSSFLGTWRLIGWSGNSAGGPTSGAISQLFSLNIATLTVGLIGILGSGIFLLMIPETLTKD